MRSAAVSPEAPPARGLGERKSSKTAGRTLTLTQYYDAIPYDGVNRPKRTAESGGKSGLDADVGTAIYVYDAFGKLAVVLVIPVRRESQCAYEEVWGVQRGLLRRKPHVSIRATSPSRPSSRNLRHKIVETARGVPEQPLAAREVVAGGAQADLLEILVHDAEIVGEPGGHHHLRLFFPVVEIVADVLHVGLQVLSPDAGAVFAVQDVGPDSPPPASALNTASAMSRASTRLTPTLPIGCG